MQTGPLWTSGAQQEGCGEPDQEAGLEPERLGAEPDEDFAAAELSDFAGEGVLVEDESLADPESDFESPDFVSAGLESELDPVDDSDVSDFFLSASRLSLR